MAPNCSQYRDIVSTNARRGDWRNRAHRHVPRPQAGRCRGAGDLRKSAPAGTLPHERPVEPRDARRTGSDGGGTGWGLRRPNRCTRPGRRHRSHLLHPRKHATARNRAARPGSALPPLRHHLGSRAERPGPDNGGRTAVPVRRLRMPQSRYRSLPDRRSAPPSVSGHGAASGAHRRDRAGRR